MKAKPRRLGMCVVGSVENVGGRAHMFYKLLTRVVIGIVAILSLGKASLQFLRPHVPHSLHDEKRRRLLSCRGGLEACRFCALVRLGLPTDLTPLCLVSIVDAANPRLYKLQPTKGPQTGGTSVTLVGTDFKSGTTLCQFGAASVVQASYLSQTSVVCVTPPGPSSGAGSVSVEVTTDNSGSLDTYSADGLLFTYQGRNSVQAVHTRFDIGVCHMLPALHSGKGSHRRAYALASLSSHGDSL
jgi:hypothetical protein